MYILDESVEIKDAEKAKQALLSAIGDHETGGFPIDLAGAEPNQVAFQIGLAALKELEARNLEAMPGTILQSLLAKNTETSERG